MVDKIIFHSYNIEVSLQECWNGRQARLRCVWLRRVGSSPISCTKIQIPNWYLDFLYARMAASLLGIHEKAVDNGQDAW